MNLPQLTSVVGGRSNWNALKSNQLSDLSKITGIVDTSMTSLNALLFPTEKPQNPVLSTDFESDFLFPFNKNTQQYDDKDAYLFDIIKDYTVNYTSDITDHYTEDNVAIQDHIALKPITLQLTGVIAEQTLRRSQGKKMFDSTQTSDKAKSLSSRITNYLEYTDMSKLGSLTAFAPGLTEQALSIKNTALGAYSMANKAINFMKNVTGDNQEQDYNVPTTERTTYKQGKIQEYFELKWNNRTPFLIVTPFGIYDNMYIINLTVSQPENTWSYSNISIAFKQIRFAQTIKVEKKVISAKQEVQESKIEEIEAENPTIENSTTDLTQDYEDIMSNRLQTVAEKIPSKTININAVNAITPINANYMIKNFGVGL